MSVATIVEYIESKVVCYNSGKGDDRADMVKGANAAGNSWNGKYLAPGEVAALWYSTGNSSLKVQGENGSPWGLNLVYQYCFEITRRLMDKCNTRGTSNKQGGFFHQQY